MLFVDDWGKIFIKIIRTCVHRKKYETDIKEEQWEVIEPLFFNMRKYKWEKRNLQCTMGYWVAGLATFAYPTLEKICADGGYRDSFVYAAYKYFGLRVEIFTPTKKGLRAERYFC